MHMNRHMRRHPDLYPFGIAERGGIPLRDNGGLGAGNESGGGGKTPEQIAADVAAAAEAERQRIAAAGAGGAAGGAAGGQPLMIDGRPATQDDLNRLLTREKEQGRTAAETAMLERLGVKDVGEAEAILKAHREQQQANETEAETKARLATEATEAANKRAADADRLIRTGVLREALRDEGAPKTALDDLVTLLDKPDLDISKPDDVEAAAKALKAKYAGMFGATGATSGDPGSSGAGGSATGATGIAAGREQFTKDKADGKVDADKAGDPFAGFHRVGSS